MNRLVWFRNDLRLHDNETLTAAALNAPGEMAYVYIYDESSDELTPEGDTRMGAFRKKFLLESLRDLKRNLQKLGAELLCLKGNPSVILPLLCQQLRIEDIYLSRLTAHDESAAEHLLDSKLRVQGIRLHRFQTHTLVNDADLHFDAYAHMSFSKRRGLIETTWPVRATLPVPARLPPSLSAGQPAWIFDDGILSASEFRGFRAEGGETAARERMNFYFRESDSLSTYKETRNGLLEFNDSSKFSPYLSLGCVSARSLYQETRRYERERLKNGSTMWFLFELLWRDHFHFLAKPRGAQLFNQAAASAKENKPVIQFERWRKAQTGETFVDAAMTEIRLTGWLSNRMRQVAASYLVHNLGADWRMGARWFEHLLIDYDPCSNWGNWAYIAGADGAGKSHKFDIAQQATMYDADSRYRKLWNVNETSPPK